MNLPLVNIFNPPCEIWEMRSLTEAEIRTPSDVFAQIPDKIKAHLDCALEAAKYIGRVGEDNVLGDFINKALDASQEFKTWRNAMPSRTPASLEGYQKSYPFYNREMVHSEIKKIGHMLSDGQYLFHAGMWPNGGHVSFVTDRPLSTTFCPQVALRNAEHKGKAYDAGRIDLFVLRVTNPSTNVFVYRRAGTSLGHENEVLFAEGATLKLMSTDVVNQARWAYKIDDKTLESLKKSIQVRVLMVEIS